MGGGGITGSSATSNPQARTVFRDRWGKPRGANTSGAMSFRPLSPFAANLPQQRLQALPAHPAEALHGIADLPPARRLERLLREPHELLRHPLPRHRPGVESLVVDLFFRKESAVRKGHRDPATVLVREPLRIFRVRDP